LVHASKIVDPEFQVVNQNKSKVTMPASFLNNQSAGTVLLQYPERSIKVPARETKSNRPERRALHVAADQALQSIDKRVDSRF